MRFLRKPALTPPTLRLGKPGGNKAASQERDYLADPAAKFSFPGHWNEPDVRGALIAAQNRLCAYCLSERHYDELEVEHFRPKSVYWWLAYHFENYYLACRTCNSIATKGSLFPLRGTPPARIPYADRNRLHTELRALIDPGADQWLENAMTFRIETLDCVLQPLAGLPPDREEMVRSTIQFFVLSEDVQLLKERIAVHDQVLPALKAGDAPSVRHLAHRFRPHSLVARELLKLFREDLPTPEEELDGLLDVLMGCLAGALRILQRNATSKRAIRMRDEILWALAFIWKDPPARSPQHVENFLGRFGIDQIVKTYYDQL